MARTRSMLLKAEVRPAGRACDCKHSKQHRIAKGEPRLVVQNAGPASGESGYCTSCGIIMIAAAREQLDRLAQELGEGQF